jgi:hypothetical protein
MEEVKPKLYLFLDMDGVLNNPSWWQFVYALDSAPRDHRKELDPRSLSLFNHMCREIDRFWELKLIISSTWRGGTKDLKELQEKFSSYGITHPVSGRTGPHGGCRGGEIMDFLQDHNIEDDYIILDDESDAVYGHDQNKFVWCHPTDGFTVHQYREVLYRIDFYKFRMKSKGFQCANCYRIHDSMEFTKKVDDSTYYLCCKGCQDEFTGPPEPKVVLWDDKKHVN